MRRNDRLGRGAALSFAFHLVVALALVFLASPPAVEQPPRQATPTPPSQSTQPNPAKTPAPDSRALLNTLDRLRSLRQSNDAPTARYSPPASGAPVTGGSVHGTDNTSLNAVQRGAIGEKV